MDENGEDLRKEDILVLMMMEVRKDLLKKVTGFKTDFEIAEGVKINIHPLKEGELLSDGRIAFTLNPEIEKRFSDYFQLIKEEAERNY